MPGFIWRIILRQLDAVGNQLPVRNGLVTFLTLEIGSRRSQRLGLEWSTWTVAQVNSLILVWTFSIVPVHGGAVLSACHWPSRRNYAKKPRGILSEGVSFLKVIQDRD